MSRPELGTDRWSTAALTGVWAVAGTPISAPYPCTCPIHGHAGNKFCRCWGRPDTDDAPTNCCSPTWHPKVPPTTKDT